MNSCTSATYDGADSATASVAGTCTDKAGNTSGPLGFGLKYDETAPQVTAGTPRRAPDVDGWYNRAVAFDFEGADATSGIAACPSVTYSGPDGGAASVTGRCTDRAGNSADRAFGVRYDATAPEVASATPDRPPDAAGLVQPPGHDRLRRDRRGVGRRSLHDEDLPGPRRRQPPPSRGRARTRRAT